MKHVLEFERGIVELEAKIHELRHMTHNHDINIMEEISRLEGKIEKQLKQIYQKLTPWQKTQIARHPERPHAADYIKHCVSNFLPLYGDRCFGEDAAIISGIGKIGGYSAIILGTEKGHDTEDRIKHNFGMAKPEGYRKAIRLMQLADHLKLPIISFIDTAGAYPGLDAEARGQAQAIAKAIEVAFSLHIPSISIIIGEGGSGGAVALATANKVFMLEHAIYSVISPEGCASILWRSSEYAQNAAEALCLTAQDLLRFDVIDDIIPEPQGGAHRAPHLVMEEVHNTIITALKELLEIDGDKLKADRRERFLKIGRTL